MPKGVNLKKKMSNKTTEKNTVKMSAKEKREKTIKELQSKGRDNLSGYELQRLISALWKKEEKSLRYVYNQLKGAYNSDKPTEIEKRVKELAGANFPTFAKFKGAYTLKHFSKWGGLSVLRKLNPNYQRAQRVKRQNKAQSKKA